VRHKGRLSELLAVSSGVRQGCVLSPLLFLIVLDDLIEIVNERCPNGIQWGLTNKLTDIDYADICILYQRAGDMQDKLTTLAEEGQKFGLKINTNKTEIMKINCKKKNVICVVNEPLRETDSVCYLGSVTITDGGVEVDIRNRQNRARAAFTTLKPVWDSTKLKTMTKLRIFNSNVKSVLLYACESWLVSCWPAVISNQQLWQKSVVNALCS
jgi:hypothetical protein